MLQFIFMLAVFCSISVVYILFLEFFDVLKNKEKELDNLLIGNSEDKEVCKYKKLLNSISEITKLRLFTIFIIIIIMVIGSYFLHKIEPDNRDYYIKLHRHII
jgi:hypothetical protein